MNKPKTKLLLNRDTLRNLDGNQLRRAAGAARFGISPSCPTQFPVCTYWTCLGACTDECSGPWPTGGCPTQQACNNI